ncbi:MAG TPA: NrfD/PsrC family molybdoenzyme membrane anchor subunit [Chloroflexota bacterium]|nr:NrfD/PsrC family molybdoenzyme membrane anchor subunit [Chloroflexota bacterium]
MATASVTLPARTGQPGRQPVVPLGGPTSAAALWERALWALAAAGIAAGAFGLVQRLTLGHLAANYGSYIPWGLWIALYVAGVGAAAGAFSVAGLAYLAGVRALRPIAPLALVASGASMAAGLTFVWLDLGRPERALNLLLRWSPRSVMGWMTVFYGLFTLALVALLYAVWTKREGWLRPLAAAGTAVMVAFAGGEGALFGVLGARPYWNSGMRPIEFLAGGLLAGVAVVAIAAATVLERGERRRAALLALRPYLLALLGLNALLLWAETTLSLYAAIPAHAEAYRLVLQGPHAWVFWGIQVAVGIILPLALLARPVPATVGFAGLAILVGYVGSKLNMVIPGLAVSELQGLASAYVHERLTFHYLPSAAEWLLAGGVVGMALVLFLGASRLLRVTSVESPAAEPAAIAP